MQDVLLKMIATPTKETPDDGFISASEGLFNTVPDEPPPDDSETPIIDPEPNKQQVGKFTVEDEFDEGDKDEIPGWVLFPDNFKVPVGRTLIFIKLKANWTDNPAKGDRIVVCWLLSDADEDAALARCNNKSYRMVTEFTKGMIRAVDGKRAVFPGATVKGVNDVVNINVFWREIGSKCRQLLEGIYSQTHKLTTEELVDFFQDCMITRTAG